jgi:hypothetical protein
VVGLSREPAHVEGDAVKGHARFGPHGTQQRLTGHVLVQGDAGGRRGQSPGAAHQAVGQHQLALAARNLRGVGRRLEQPVRRSETQGLGARLGRGCGRGQGAQGQKQQAGPERQQRRQSHGRTLLRPCDCRP